MVYIFFKDHCMSTFKFYHNVLCTFTRKYAKKGKTTKGIAAVAKIREINVETDPEKIVNCCCINYRIGEQPIPLKPDNEYPDWLWKLRTDRGSPPLEEVDKNSYYYWRRIRKMNRNLINKLASVDGWHRKDHRSFENHALRFYGNLYLAVSEWSNSKKLLENKN
ncbi:unnamed protein product [Schistosoma mattheei]|uniref:Large ribosomal subunit protein mL54 n=2 Tax=Schistosoma mattheei TaxID=31246 RepID=A0AA85BYE6_9TREM|nr:unnamed protein product [Schistosoma mattheei]